MSGPPLIQATAVSKKYCRDLRKSLWYGMCDLSRAVALRQQPTSQTLRDKEFWAIQNVNFEVSRGECLGLIGPNGAGKTTLLKMLSGLIPPDEGEIALRGRLGALIALGAGFHPLLSGRENIYINASVLGVPRKIIDQKLDEIIDFSGIDEFIDSPVQSYSSGMTVRLGFAIAAKLIQPDILLLDEILAVGDQAFRAKCYETISNTLDRSAVIFVSHSMQAINRISTKTLLLDKGKQIYIGPTANGIRCYQDICDANTGTSQRSLGTGEVEVRRAQLLNVSGKSTDTLISGQPFSLQLELQADSALLPSEVSLMFVNNQQELVAQCHSSATNFTFHTSNSISTIDIAFQELSLNPGSYTINLVVNEKKSLRHLCWDIGLLKFKVIGPFFGTTSVQFAAHWQQNRGQ